MVKRSTHRAAGRKAPTARVRSGGALPLVIAYQVWAYRLFHAKITAGDLAYEEAY